MSGPGCRVGTLLGWVLAVLVVAAPAQGRDQATRLEQIRREIEIGEERARAYREQADGYLGEVDALDRELNQVRRSIRRLRQRQQAAEQELSEARAGLSRADQEMRETHKNVETRLVALYKFRSTGGIPSLYRSGDFRSFARRRLGLARVLDQDVRLFDRHRSARAAWAHSHQRSESLVAELRAAHSEIEPREQRFRQALVERRNLVAVLRSRSEHEQRAAEALREAARRLEEVLARMPSRFESPAGAGLQRGQVPWPVVGQVRLGFGPLRDPEFGTKIRRTGIEIGAAAGRPVRAVAPGRVLFAGWFRGYGQLVIVDHGGGSVTVSGYLDEIAVKAGAKLEASQVIGTVGETGSLLGPGLYFELRRDGKPVDPRTWLESEPGEGA